MKILSINVSEPKKIMFNGKELITSIYKNPIEGSVEIKELGVQGDRQADIKVHGGYDKAVYGYSFKHYKYWSDKLGRDFTKFGLVGENLTIDDFDEKEISIGDQLKISNCLLEVTQPRIPCYKLGIKMNDRSFPKLFTQSGLLGIYMKVINDGNITKNDEIEIVKKQANSLTVFEISNLIFNDLNNKEQMNKALNITALTEEIKERFRERLMKLGDFSCL